MDIQERNRHIAAAYSGGESVIKIAARAGLTTGRVYAILHSMGIKPDRQGQGRWPVKWDDGKAAVEA